MTVDAARPHAVQVLGRDLVVWRDPISGSWHAGDDACPHRLAPLSEGRIEVRKGKNDCGDSFVLACAYHGARKKQIRERERERERERVSFFHSLLFCLFPSLLFLSWAHARNENNAKKKHPKIQGWEFDSKGACTRIPQLEDDPSAKATALASLRCRVRSYPVCVKAGLVFVWPDAEPGAEERASQAAPPPVPAEVVDKVEESGW